MKNDIRVGSKIYIPGSMSISNGSSDVAGGQATISKIEENISAGEKCRFVEVKEVPGHQYNWDTYLKPLQDQLKKEYKNQIAHPDPDIDTPWIEEGDIVNGEKYIGKSIW